MIRWLSSAWEANWRPFRYFNLYRLILAMIFLSMQRYSPHWTEGIFLFSSPLVHWGGGVYLIALLGGLLASFRYLHRFNLQLTLQVVADVLMAVLLMRESHGAASSLGVLLLISLAAASLVGRGRLVLFYAAVATLTVLLMQLHGVWQRDFELASIMQAGFLSAGFFATAILARLLGQRLMYNEELARRRGVDLENQQLISRRIMECTQDGVLVVSPNGEVVGKNPVAIDMLGLPELPATTIADCSPDLARAFFLWQGQSDDDVTEFRSAVGCSVRARFERTASPYRQALVFLEDLGHVQHQAQQLKLVALGRLTASIAHEIRNPLSAISHAGELLQEEVDGEIARRLLRITQDNVRRLDRIVQDVLELGRGNASCPETILLADECMQFIEDFLHAQNIPLARIRLAIPADASLWFDRSQFRQVLWNLLSNALRYASAAPGSIQLVVEQSGAGRLSLHMLDDGPGIPEEVRLQLFEPFFTTYAKGTGLGLFIARELCVSNGASLEVVVSPHGGHFVLTGKTGV